MRECLICFEDKRFYRHWGVDVLALGRAMWAERAQQAYRQRGSTLTMQVIRLARQRPRTLPEKAIEALWATRLEFRCSKQEILAMYASHAPFGGNVVGLDAAAWRYFGHSAENCPGRKPPHWQCCPMPPPSSPRQRQGRTPAKTEPASAQTTRTRKAYGIRLHIGAHEPLPQAPQALPQQAPHLVNYLNQTRNGCIPPLPSTKDCNNR